jgi:Flp pilus assembly protein TadB
LLEEVLVPEVRVHGTSALRTRLIQAGEGHHGPAWVRTRQAGLAIVFVCVAWACLWTGVIPPGALPPALLLAAAAGVVVPYADLAYRASQRRERLCQDLVPFLYAIAALVAAGATLERALAEVASEEGELTGELAEALKLRGTGVSLQETLRVMHERCATPEVTGALRCIVLARRRGEGMAGTAGHVAPALRALAESTLRRLLQRRRERKERARLTSTALLVLLCLPALMVSVLYPAVIMALRAGH